MNTKLEEIFNEVLPIALERTERLRAQELKMAAATNEPIKLCCRCLTWLPISKFYTRTDKRTADRFGKTSKCIECSKKKTREWYARTKKAPISVCQICGNVEKLMQDHDHTTGLNRGLLCHSCNVALGHLRDDATLLQKAIEYLEKYRRNNVRQ